MWGNFGAGELRCVGITVWGSCDVCKLQRNAVAVYRNCGLWGLRCAGVAVWGSLNLRKSWCVAIVV